MKRLKKKLVVIFTIYIYEEKKKKDLGTLYRTTTTMPNRSSGPLGSEPIGAT